MYQRSAGSGSEDAFADRGVHLGETFDRTGRLEGDLTATATAALRTVLNSLAGKAGPRTSAPRPSAPTTPWRRPACA